MGVSTPSADRLLEFKTIVDCGSITRAARELQQTRPTLSRRLGELEELLGVRLLQRTTRRLQLTAAGQDLYARASRIVTDIDAAWSAVRHYNSEPCGPLRVGVPGDEMAAEPFFLQFAAEFPKVELDVHVVHRNTDVQLTSLDVSLVFDEIRDPNLVVRKIALSRRHATATRAYLDKEGEPASISEIRDKKCIVYRDVSGLPELRWPTTDGGHVEVDAWMTTNSYPLMVRAVHAGLGIGLVPEEERARNPELVPLFPEVICSDDTFSLVYVERDYQLPHVRAFVDRAVDYWRHWIEHC